MRKSTKYAKTACRRCGCQDWDLLVTTRFRFSSESGIVIPVNYIRREFRCLGCQTKSTVQQHATLDAASVARQVS